MVGSRAQPTIPEREPSARRRQVAQVRSRRRTIPSAAGREAWQQNGWPKDDERLLTAALRQAGIKPQHDGHTRAWWWKAKSDETPIGAELRPQECTACRRILYLPDQRYCFSTPNCPGHYQPALNVQPTPFSASMTSRGVVEK